MRILVQRRVVFILLDGIKRKRIVFILILSKITIVLINIIIMNIIMKLLILLNMPELVVENRDLPCPEINYN